MTIHTYHTYRYVVSHFHRIGFRPGKTAVRGGQSRSWSPEQGKENKKIKSGRAPPSPPPPNAARSKEIRIKQRASTKERHMTRTTSSDASTCLGAREVSVRLSPVQDSFGSSTRSIGVASQVLRFRLRYQLSRSRCLSLLLAMSRRVYILFPPRGHKPPRTLRDRLNPHPYLQRRRFPTPRSANPPGVALYAINPLVLLPAPSSPHCTLRASEHDSLDNRPPLIRMSASARKSIFVRKQRRLNALTPGYLEGTIIVRGHPMVWSLALRPGGVWCGVWRNVPGEGSTYCIHTVEPRLPRSLTFGS